MCQLLAAAKEDSVVFATVEVLEDCTECLVLDEVDTFLQPVATWEQSAFLSLYSSHYLSLLS